MKIYRVSLIHGYEGHDSYSYCSSKKAAEQIARDWTKLNDTDKVLYEAEITVHNVPITGKGIIAALERFGSHADNG